MTAKELFEAEEGENGENKESKLIDVVALA